MRCASLVSLALLLSSSLAPSAAQNRTSNKLTNGDIVRMVNAGLSESIILREIEISDSKFVTTPDALIELKNRGVPDEIMEAILDSQAGRFEAHGESLPTSHASGQSATAARHHLPSFDADVRFNSQTATKVSVRRNNINVERSGVPVFSLKWKGSQ